MRISRERTGSTVKAFAIAFTYELEPMVRRHEGAQRAGPAPQVPTARLPSRDGLFQWVAPLAPMR
jgi:hypothetical protein